MRENFVKQFKERMTVLESLTKKCEAALAQESISNKRRSMTIEEDEEWLEKLRFIESQAS